MCGAVSDSKDHSRPARSLALTRGLLITFEGPDGCGKSTVAHRCRELLVSEGYGPVGLFREPGDSEAGRQIRRLSKEGRFGVTVEEEIGLFIKDRRWDIETNVAPVLADRGVVLLDRYYHSSIAYQGARGADPAEVRRLNEDFAPKPDLVVLMQLSADDCLERIRRGRKGEPDLFEARESLEKVCALFDSMDDPEIRRFDARLPLEEVQAAVDGAVMDVLRAHHATPQG